MRRNPLFIGSGFQTRGPLLVGARVAYLCRNPLFIGSGFQTDRWETQEEWAARSRNPLFIGSGFQTPVVGAMTPPCTVRGVVIPFSSGQVFRR